MGGQSHTTRRSDRTRRKPLAQVAPDLWYSSDYWKGLASMRPSTRHASLLVTGPEPLPPGGVFTMTPAHNRPPPINIGEEEMTGA